MSTPDALDAEIEKLEGEYHHLLMANVPRKEWEDTHRRLDDLGSRIKKLKKIRYGNPSKSPSNVKGDSAPKEIDVDSIVHGSVGNPLSQRILLNGNEKVKVTASVNTLYGDSFRDGLLLITDQRLVCIQSSDGRVILDRPLENLVGIEVEDNVIIGGSLRDVLRASYSGETFIIDVQASNPPNLSSETIVEVITQLRKANMAGTNASSERDFGWLKDFLDKGGLVVTAVKCPQCGGSLDLPEEGSFVKCMYCSQTLYVEDVVKIIRELKDF